MLVFEEGEKPDYPEKTSQSREEEPTLLLVQPTYCVESGNRSRATSLGGECSHHCVIPAPLLHPCLIRNLSTRDIETQTVSGTELFSFTARLHTITFTMLSTVSRFWMISIKMCETPLSWHTECSLPVAVRVSKTRVLKLPSFRDSEEKEANVYSVFCFSLRLN